MFAEIGTRYSEIKPKDFVYFRDIKVENTYDGIVLQRISGQASLSNVFVSNSSSGDAVRIESYSDLVDVQQMVLEGEAVNAIVARALVVELSYMTLYMYSHYM